MPESSSNGTTIALSSGPSASSLFTSSAMAYDAADVATATTATSTSATAIPSGGARSPNNIATSVSRMPCTTSTTTSRIDRPSSRAVRLTGVTRIRSTTPVRYSWIRLNPANRLPNMPSWTSRAGTSTW